MSKSQTNRKKSPKKTVSKKIEPKKATIQLVDKEKMEQITEPIRHQNEAQARANQCHAEITKVLERFGCVIQAYIVPQMEPVGQLGDCVQINAGYGIRALPVR